MPEASEPIEVPVPPLRTDFGDNATLLSTAQNVSVEKSAPTIIPIHPDTANETGGWFPPILRDLDVELPRIASYGQVEELPHTTPIQIWEGKVLEVDEKAGTIQVRLSAKLGNVEDHTGEIDLEWVAEQDRDLVKPGAIFYWTLFKETKRGSIKNSQELKFRRLPSWSKSQLARVRDQAEMLWNRLRMRASI